MSGRDVLNDRPSDAALAEESAESRCATVGMIARTTPTARTAAPIQITRFLRSTFGARRTSVAEVSRIMGLSAPAADMAARPPR